MKRKAIIPLLLGVMCGFWGCNREFGPGPRPEPNPIPDMWIIKFEKPEYKDYIMTLSPRPEDTLTVPYAGDFVLPLSVENLYGQSPYIELSEDYLLVDWHWKNMFILRKEAIIKEKWENFRYTPNEQRWPVAQWPIDMLYVDRPVVECYTIEPNQIEQYLHGDDHPTRKLAHVYASESDWAGYTEEQKEETLKNVAWNDSLYVRYTPVLCRMIEEGKLDDYGMRCRLNEE